MLRVRYVPRVISVTCLTSDSSLIQWSVSSTQFIWCVYVCVHVCKREVMERRGRGGREKERRGRVGERERGRERKESGEGERGRRGETGREGERTVVQPVCTPMCACGGHRRTAVCLALSPFIPFLTQGPLLTSLAARKPCQFSQQCWSYRPA
jgi:hypothetical protein